MANEYDVIELLFGGMEKLGPGSEADTLHVLNLLPGRDFHLVVDAGCGSGRQTLTLAKALGVIIHAVDIYEPFLSDLSRRAGEAGVKQFVQVHCMDMKDIPAHFHNIDLLWSEGAAYNIGFSNALRTWASAIDQNGFAVISELSWLRRKVPDTVRDFFTSGYPDMQSLQQNIKAAREAGYEVLSTHVLPEKTWVEGYYDILEPRAQALADHEDASVRDFARETLKEIEIFEQSEGSYGYVFYVLRRL